MVGGLTEEVSSLLAFYFGQFIQILEKLRLDFNLYTSALEHWQVAAYTFAATCFWLWLRAILISDRPLIGRVKHTFFKLIRYIPGVESRIRSELAKVRADLDESVHKSDPKREFIRSLPDRPLIPDDISAEAEKYEQLSPFDYTSGKISGAVYSDMPEELMKLQRRIFELFSYANPLHPDIFPGVRKMEAEVVRMICGLYNGDANTCGTMTAGGTESILLAMLACRNRAYDRGIDHPEMVIPITAHAAFDKAASYFRIIIRHVPVDPDTMQANVAAMKSYINRNTCVLVGSAPCFPHGTIDPLAEISALGVKYDIPVHVDACLGGFLLPFMDQLGYPIKAFDFRLAGVTSISCDTHKYGFCPKGSSIVMYRDQSMLHYQYFAQVDWTGGLYATATTCGSKSGLQTALVWATMLYYGKEGYKNATRSVIDTTQYIRSELEEIEQLTLYGTSEMSVISIGSEVFNIYGLFDELTARGWALNSLQNPPAFHLCVTVNHTKPGVADSFIRDLRECTQAMVRDPTRGSKTTALYGTSASLPDRGIVAECVFMYLDCCYSTQGLVEYERKTSRQSSSVDGAVYGRAHSMAADSEAMQKVMQRLQKLSEEPELK